jgi:DNA polymerase
MSVHPKTKQWWRGDTYGGTLVENIVQATARDLMAEAMLRVEATGKYRVLMTVHDEVVAECDEGTGDLKEFERLVAEVPRWAEGCPVNAEGWIGQRYRK